VSAPSLSKRKKRQSSQIRTAEAAGRSYRDQGYQPQYALGIVCRDEQDQISLHKKVRRITGERDVRVLVI